VDEHRIRELLQQFDTTRFTEIEAAWEELRELGGAVVPFLREAYPDVRRWQGRAALVYYSIPFARISREAFQLGLAALSDRATVVRYRACMLLAYSLNSEAIPALEQLLSHADPKTVADARAALDAIRHQNHHYFVDRDHTRRMRWELAPSDPEELLEYQQAVWSEVAQARDADQGPSPGPGKGNRTATGCIVPALLALGVIGSAIWLAAGA